MDGNPTDKCCITPTNENADNRVKSCDVTGDVISRSELNVILKPYRETRPALLMEVVSPNRPQLQVNKSPHSDTTDTTCDTTDITCDMAYRGLNGHKDYPINGLNGFATVASDSCVDMENVTTPISNSTFNHSHRSGKSLLSHSAMDSNHIKYTNGQKHDKLDNGSKVSQLTTQINGNSLKNASSPNVSRRIFTVLSTKKCDRNDNIISNLSQTTANTFSAKSFSQSVVSPRNCDSDVSCAELSNAINDKTKGNCDIPGTNPLNGDFRTQVGLTHGASDSDISLLQDINSTSKQTLQNCESQDSIRLSGDFNTGIYTCDMPNTCKVPSTADIKVPLLKDRNSMLSYDKQQTLKKCDVQDTAQFGYNRTDVGVIDTSKPCEVQFDSDINVDITLSDRHCTSEQTFQHGDIDGTEVPTEGNTWDVSVSNQCKIPTDKDSKAPKAPLEGRNSLVKPKIDRDLSASHLPLKSENSTDCDLGGNDAIPSIKSLQLNLEAKLLADMQGNGEKQLSDSHSSLKDNFPAVSNCSKGPIFKGSSKEIFSELGAKEITGLTGPSICRVPIIAKPEEVMPCPEGAFQLKVQDKSLKETKDRLDKDLKDLKLKDRLSAIGFDESRTRLKVSSEPDKSLSKVVEIAEEQEVEKMDDFNKFSGLVTFDAFFANVANYKSLDCFDNGNENNNVGFGENQNDDRDKEIEIVIDDVDGQDLCNNNYDDHHHSHHDDYNHSDDDDCSSSDSEVDFELRAKLLAQINPLLLAPGFSDHLHLSNSGSDTDDSSSTETSGSTIIDTTQRNDLERVKGLAQRLKLNTKRPSFVAWKEQIIDKPYLWRHRVAHRVVNKDIQDDWSAERLNRITEALAWLRSELMDMRVQDQVIARQLVALRKEIHRVKLEKLTAEHQDMIEDACEMESERRDELAEIDDAPPDMFSPTLKHFGVTHYNISTRRFSVF